ncbi:PREDICTED: coordinator of PRMT5 and differentiation stimulator [Elephantulus edwardii]|uniref:coordinator of PRMT5 and differentiation stimulator n=1 Tax=Elephantulus edwardii TaxID=28737 RepID=UPI0003F06171|nr:PREDICTED: coordinator of PRMT5 and differentiation stimulator [Elephantulus edwardii]
MDPQATGAQVLGAAELPRDSPLPGAREAALSSGPANAECRLGARSGRERPGRGAPRLWGGNCEGVGGRVASGAQSIPNDIPLHDEGAPSDEEGFPLDGEDSDGEPNAWALPGGVSSGLPKEETAGLFHEDWDLELKSDQGNPYDADDIQGSLSQEIKPWVCCAPQGDMVYDPSWHHPPPLIPHYSKMVFETGQFDDAED